MSVVTEGRHTGHFLLSEANGTRSRDVVTLAAGSGDLAAGAVLGKITASSKFAPHAPSASDGSETAVAILLGNVSVPAAADVDAVVVARDAEVKAASLGFAAATDTDAEKTVVLAALAANGIIGR